MALLIAAAAAIGLGAAAAAVIATGNDTRAATRQVSTAKATPVDNRFRLSRAESLRLVGWAARLRDCMGRRGVALAEPVARAKEIDLAIVRAPARRALARSVFACGDALGEPPRRSSLQLRHGRLVLYLPRQCLLDKTVVSGRAS